MVTTYTFLTTMPRYAVRRISDGFFLNQEGQFQSMGGETNGHYNGDRNDHYIDYRTSPDHWNPLPEGCEVVTISEVTNITAVPVNW